VITSPHNRLVKAAIALRVPRLRRKEGRVLVEGRKAVRDAIDAGARVEHALIAAGFEGEPLSALERARVPVYAVAPALFARIAATEVSQGIAAVAIEPRAKAAAILAAPGEAPLAVLDRIQDPGNLGTILRTAAALGFRGALLAPGTTDPFAPKVVRASAAALFRLPAAPLDDPALLEAAGFALVCAAEGGGPPHRVFAGLAGARVALVVGNEGQGIAPDMLDRARARVWIPLARGVESLNAAAAFAILGWELMRAVTASGRHP
jgi:TrmH family RNA methyltransferase